MDPLLVVTVCYTFFGLDALGDPFGLETNDLPLDAMVRVIERELLDALGRTNLPSLLLIFTEVPQRRGFHGKGN